MGVSNPENKPWIEQEIKKINPSKVLDVGAGAGIYLDLIRNALGNDVIVDAVEVWSPYIEYFNLRNRYNNVYESDVRDFLDFDYDLVIFGDVLEHMTEQEAVQIWDRVSKKAKNAIISIPIIHYHQDAINNNPYEIHVEEDWDTERVLNNFSHIVEYKEFDVTGSFIAKFKE